MNRFSKAGIEKSRVNLRLLVCKLSLVSKKGGKKKQESHDLS
jgi:hypothetical protein